MKKNVSATLAGVLAIATMGSQSSCAPDPTSNDKQRAQQEQMLAEGTSQVGMPAIINFRERKMMKQIMELRDQASFTTYTYVFSEMSGKLIPFCRSIGYPIPYATQFTAPEAMQSYYVERASSSDRWGISRLPQADPNGLFSPSAADGTWVMCQDPKHPDKVMPVYSEPKLIGSPWRLSDEKFPGES